MREPHRQSKKMQSIQKTSLRHVVFCTAHNSGDLTDQVQLGIEIYDQETYQCFLEVALQKREHHDITGKPGGGTSSAAYLKEALAHLPYILSH
jgi:hypothetical protein